MRDMTQKQRYDTEHRQTDRDIDLVKRDIHTKRQHMKRDTKKKKEAMRRERWSSLSSLLFFSAVSSPSIPASGSAENLAASRGSGKGRDGTLRGGTKRNRRGRDKESVITEVREEGEDERLR